MRKYLWLLTLALLVVVPMACSKGAGTPTSPDNSALQTAVAQDKSPTLLCHANPDVDDGDPAWVVIETAGRAQGHYNHGDYDTGSCADLGTLAVGDDCTCCSTGGCTPL